MTAIPAPRALLLDLLGDAHDLDAARFAALSAADWDDLARIAVQHRIEPLLHWQLEHRHRDAPVPDPVRAAWAAAFVASSRRQPRMQFEIRALAQLLGAAGIDAIMLKGAFLAFHAYPDPALRPLRDVDVLVPDDRAEQAYRALRAAGAEPEGDDEAALAYALRIREHHLPILATPRGFALVEVHRHIQSLASVAADDRDAQLIDDLRNHAVTLPLADVAIAYPAPTDMLLHLVLHAAGNHALDNGPLAIADIAFLLRHHAIEWERFWASAMRIRMTRAAALLLELAQRYWGPLAVVWDGGAGAPPGLAQVGDHAATILLQDRELTPDVWRGRQSELGARRGLGWWWRGLFLPRLEMAMIYDLPPRSPWVWTRYPLRWWSLAKQAMPRLRARSHDEVRGQLDAHDTVARWLSEP